MQPLNNPVPLILLFTAIGFSIGAIIAYFVARNDARKQQAPTAENSLIEERNKRFQEIAGLWREKAGGKLGVWMGNRMLGDLNLVDVADRQSLESAGHELLAWLGAAEKPVSETAEQPATTKLGTGPLPARTGTGPLGAKMGTGPLFAKPGLADSSAGENAPTATELAAGEEMAKPPKPLSIVEQINDILQGMLKETPLAARSIRLVEDPREGVIVLVGLERYKGVDSVPDPDIRAALRQAAAEWERRTGKVRH